MREHDGLHARAAHFVDGDCAGGGGQSCAESGLTRGSLAEAGGENAADEDFVDRVGGTAARSIAARMAAAPSWGAVRSLRSPWNAPMGVRAEPTITMGS